MAKKTKVDYVNEICKIKRITEKKVICYLFRLKNEELKMILNERLPLYKKNLKKLQNPEVPTRKAFVDDIFTKFEKQLLDTRKVSNLLEEPPDVWYPKYKK